AVAGLARLGKVPGAGPGPALAGAAPGQLGLRRSLDRPRSVIDLDRRGAEDDPAPAHAGDGRIGGESLEVAAVDRAADADQDALGAGEQIDLALLVQPGSQLALDRRQRRGERGSQLHAGLD